MCIRDRSIGLLECSQGRMRTLDLDDEALVPLVLQLQHDGLLGIVHVVEDDPSVLIERSGREYTWQLRPDQLQPVPPSPRGLGVDLHRHDVGERNRQPALERPELVDSLYIEVDETVFYRDTNHATLPV